MHFYRSTQILRRLPVLCLAIGEAVIFVTLLVMMICNPLVVSAACSVPLDTYVPETDPSPLGNTILLGYMCFFPMDAHTDFSRQAIAQALVVLEAIVSLPWYLVYICRSMDVTVRPLGANTYAG